MQARTTTSVIPILLLSLIFLLFSVQADAETKLPIAVVPNIGDPSDVGHAIFSPNGQLLATSDTLNSANSITLWDIASARPLRRLEHYAYFTAFSFTPDSALIASAHKDGTVNLWDVATGAIIATLKETLKPGEVADFEGVQSLSIDDKGEVLVSGSPTVIAVWNIAQRKRIFKFKLPALDKYGNYANIVAAQLSLDGSKLIVISRAYDGSGSIDSVRTFDLKTGKVSTFLKLPKNYSFAENAIIGDSDFVVRFSRVNCATDDLLFFSLKDPRNFLSLYKPVNCEKRKEGYPSNAPKIFVGPGRSELIVAKNGDPELEVWDWHTRRLVRKIRWPDDASSKVMALAQDFSLAVAQDATSIRVYELESGTLVKDLRAYGYSAEEAVVSNDGQHILLGRKQSSAEPDQKDIQLWQVDELSPRMVRLRVSRDVTLYDFAPDRNLALGGNDKGEILLFSTETGREHRRFYVRGIKEFEKARLSPNGKLIGLLGSDAKDKRVAFVVSSDDGKVKLSLKGRDNRNGVMASVGGNDTSDFVTSMAFSADGAKFAVGRWNGTVELWTMDKFQRTKVLPQGDKESLDQILALVFSQDGQFLLGGSRDSGVFMWDLPKNRFVRTFQRGDDLAGHVHFESVAMSQDGRLVAGGLVQHAFSSGDTGAESGIKVWDARDGKLLFILRGHAGGIGALTFSANDRWIISGSYDGTIRYWDRTTGKWIATFTAAQDGRWMINTESGFFAGSPSSDDLINVVRGLEAFSVAQFRDHLYRPDLVEHLLKGDPEQRYQDAAHNLNLQKILDSGSAPQIELLPDRKIERAGDTVRVTVRVNNTGGGIGGNVVWRVNGVTAGSGENERSTSDRPDRDYRIITETLKIDPSRKNVIEVMAYNGAGLLATEPFRIGIDADGGVSESPRPRMFVVAVGVSDYVRADWKLQFAAKDAESFAEAIKATASGLYDDVKVRIVPEAQATRKGIGAAFADIRTAVKATDVFVLFVAGHGRTLERTGTYYFLPRDLTFDGGRSVEDGIGQDTWQAWLKQIPAQKSILVFDTCESSAAAGLTRGGRERETAIDRLRYATGRSVITAARQAAYEGYKGHGVLTYAILDALTAKQGEQPQEVDLYQLAAYVDREVPEITQNLFGVRQRPHNKIEGNFPIGLSRLGLVPNTGEPTIPAQPTHVLKRAERVRERPAADAPGERELPPGSQVRVVEFVGDWAIVARAGQKMGYVPVGALLELQ